MCECKCCRDDDIYEQLYQECFNAHAFIKLEKYGMSGYRLVMSTDYSFFIDPIITRALSLSLRVVGLEHYDKKCRITFKPC